jgi:hypothetical protein
VSRQQRCKPLLETLSLVFIAKTDFKPKANSADDRFKLDRFDPFAVEPMQMPLIGSARGKSLTVFG